MQVVERSVLGRLARGLVGALAGLVALAAFAAPAQAKWLKAETEHFVVYGEGSEGRLRDYAAKLETFDDLLRKRHKLRPLTEPERKLPVYVVGNLRELRRLNPTATENVAGYYSANEQDVYAVAIAGRDDDSMFHEYVHHFMLRHFPTAYPAWLVEGYAEYYMTADIKPTEVTFGEFNPARTSWLVHGNWMPLASLLKPKPAEVRQGDRPMYYPQAWLLTHYFLGDPARTAQLAEYASAVAGGADPVKAMEAATGGDLRALENALHKYLRGGMKYARLPRKMLITPTVTVSPLPASADDLLLEHQLVRVGAPESHRRDLLQRVRARAAKHPGDTLAELTLARAEIAYGDRAAGEAILARRLQAQPEDVEALRLLAQSRIAAAEAQKDDPKARRAMFREAQKHIVRAMGIDQSDYQTLLVYARSRAEEPSYPTDNDLNALVLAHQRAPQVNSTRVNAAAALLKRGKTREATMLLQPLVNNPHAGEAAVRARALLEGATKAQAAAPAAKP